MASARSTCSRAASITSATPWRGSRPSQINHLVSQTSGSFESPRFRSGFGLENISNYEQSVQPIVKKGEYAVNYSSFDFSPLLRAAQPGVTPAHGLFHLTVEGVRPRTPEDGAAAEGSPDQDWVPVSPSTQPELRLPATAVTADSGTSYPLGDRPQDQRFILVTDLGLIMKEAADGSRMIYVQSFSGRGPVEDVEISVLSTNGTVLKNATTNRDRPRRPALAARLAAGEDPGGPGGEKGRRPRLHSLGQERPAPGHVALRCRRRLLQREVGAGGLPLHGARDLSSRGADPRRRHRPPARLVGRSDRPAAGVGGGQCEAGCGRPLPAEPGGGRSLFANHPDGGNGPHRAVESAIGTAQAGRCAITARADLPRRDRLSGWRNSNPTG